MTRHEDLVRVRHALDAAQRAIASTEGWTRQDLRLTELATQGIIRLLEILGEAASSVSTEMRQAHPQVPWRDMIGLRNRLIHGYFHVDLDIVWDTLRHELPDVVSALEKLLEGLEPPA